MISRRTILSTLLLLIISTTACGRERNDSLLLNRMFSYASKVKTDTQTITSNVYLKQTYNVKKRNLMLWVIPSTYSLAKGERSYLGEQYGRLTYKGSNDFDFNRQVIYTTVPHSRRPMPILQNLLVPHIYHPTLFNGNTLSPFHRYNRKYYRYNVETTKEKNVYMVTFRPLVGDNIQLVKGYAYVERSTGRIKQVMMSGQYDLIHYHLNFITNAKGKHIQLPKYSKTNTTFNFLGNKVSSSIEAVLDCPITLPDTMDVEANQHLMDSIRPVKLNKEERREYAHYDSLHTQRPEETADSSQHKSTLVENSIDFIGENLIGSLGSESKRGYVRLSPILNPQYVGYSQSQGFSYKMQLGAAYQITKNKSISTEPFVGYNFKLKRFYFQVPVNYTYNQKCNNYLQLTIGNGNHIGNSAVLEEIREEFGDLPELEEDNELNVFNDYYVTLTNSFKVNRWMRMETGITYHRRNSLNPDGMRRFDKPENYQSIAPNIAISMTPFEKGPVFTLTYEKGLKTKYTILDYERWEADLSMKKPIQSTHLLNVRLGGGFYSRKSNNYFMDYANFRANNLPNGWDDDWSGDFQLLDSKLFNESRYYLRGNVSYESPLMIVSFLPIIGHYVNRERNYINTLHIPNLGLYSELGYGLSCHYFSMGLFASFNNLKYQSFGCRFTIELFRHW